MKSLKIALVVATALAVFCLHPSNPTTANVKYQKETNKKCLDCHKKVPKKGEDPQLTELGKKFAENGHKLPG